MFYSPIINQCKECMHLSTCSVGLPSGMIAYNKFDKHLTRKWLQLGDFNLVSAKLSSQTFPPSKGWYSDLDVLN